MPVSRGMTILELLVVLAILGILLALGVGNLRPDRVAVDQAAQILAAQVGRTRLEAIRNNTYAGLALISSGSTYMGTSFPAGGYVVCLDINADSACGAGDQVLQQVRFGEGELSRVRLLAGSGVVWIGFDSRGMPRLTGAVTVNLSNAAGTYVRQLGISVQGRASL
ncbi:MULTISPECIES: GspH/FimT family protein [unclassified Meiothermus]|uniref:GspH/FimT family protein n=1 Tax=Meiothermus sp. Pnk-1 TaxID=873128 RepID=UPI0021066CA7|nr:MULTISPECIES: GspH/FimT family protein [unclassified Meiothermus]